MKSSSKHSSLLMTAAVVALLIACSDQQGESQIASSDEPVSLFPETYTTPTGWIHKIEHFFPCPTNFAQASARGFEIIKDGLAIKGENPNLTSIVSQDGQRLRCRSSTFGTLWQLRIQDFVATYRPGDCVSVSRNNTMGFKCNLPKGNYPFAPGSLCPNDAAMSVRWSNGKLEQSAISSSPVAERQDPLPAVAFSLTEVSIGETKVFTAGAFAGYEFPLCRRIKWSRLEFRCVADYFDKVKWQLVSGSFTDDNFCHHEGDWDQAGLLPGYAPQ